jgi:hypothetical protein
VGASLIMTVSGMYYLYGGSDGVDTFADVWQYNIAINTWLYINAKTTNTQQPAPERHFHFAYARASGGSTKMSADASFIPSSLIASGSYCCTSSVITVLLAGPHFTALCVHMCRLAVFVSGMCWEVVPPSLT